MATKLRKTGTSLADLPLPELSDARSWLIVGLDLSLSRTGYTFLHVTPGSAHVLAVGSIKPKNSEPKEWIRSFAIAQVIAQFLRNEVIIKLLTSGTQVMLAVEAPTPRNDFLTTINRIVCTVLLGPGSPLTGHAVKNLYINASTLRSYMGLTQRGSANKKENRDRAWEYVPKDRYPGLDFDSCDAVLMAMVGRFAAQILMGERDLVPPQFQRMLLDDTQVIKGKEDRVRIKLKGLLHDPAYWFEHNQDRYELMLRDATSDAVRATKLSLVI